MQSHTPTSILNKETRQIGTLDKKVWMRGIMPQKISVAILAINRPYLW